VHNRDPNPPPQRAPLSNRSDPGGKMLDVQPVRVLAANTTAEDIQAAY
jgi:hypothetical protein